MAAIASVFLALLPSILPRTIAGIPEKEAAGFLFIFLGLGLFILAWKAKTRTMTFIYAALAGIVTGMMSLTWGGAIYITLTIAIATLAAYFLKRISMREYLAYLMWIVVHVAVMLPFTERFTLFGLLTSLNYIVILAPALLIIVHYLLEMPSVKPFWHKGFLTRLPTTVVAIALSVVIALIVKLVVAGPDLIMSRLISLKNIIFNPVAGRVNVTVAENRQPYFTEWIANFGPQFLGIWLGFWIAFVGFVCLGWYTLREFPQKARWTLLGSAVIFILAFIFSRYDGSSILNGSNFISYALLIIGFLVFAWMWGSYHWKGHHQEQFNTIPYSVLILGVFFFLALLSARSAIRLVMMLVPPVASALGFMVVESYSSLRGFFNDSSRTGKKSLFALVAALLILGSAYVALYDYRVSHATAESYVPSIYTTQWQKAMEWVRENTPTNAVFAHWWDYGYWVQSIGERATVLDGGNAIEYWNHLMGRYVLTGTVERDALEMLYAHNVTNLLIDSTEIGKYSAFSSIGSNKDYDRRSWISSFYRDESLTNELKNATSLVYRGGTLVDEDIVYTFNGTRVYLPSASVDGSAGAMVGAVIVVRNNDGSYGQARGVFVYNNKQYEIPLRYVFTQKGVQDFGTGVEAGPFFVPRITQDAQTGVQIDPAGSLLYMSNRTRNSMLAKLYLYNETIPGFRLVHTEKDPIIETIESQGVVIGDFADFQGFRGPIKIWEINYPADITFEEKYISTIYPAEIAFA
jgi:asparagine N-glycosylation enzyme membrane subunit Stt3